MANLSKVNLSKADLSEAALSRADLSEAEYDDATKWPDGFDPVAAGAKKVDQQQPDETSADESMPGSAAR